jgi:UDP-glucose 4-epimerase
LRVLVTGGAGFIASNVVDALIDAGHQVSVVDDLSTGFERNLNPRATFYKLSICDAGLSDVFERERPEVVNHHAAQMDVRRSASEPVFDAEINVLGSLNLITNCVRSGVGRIVYASTGGAIYGDPEYIPADEGHPINPISQYGVSKHTVEHYLFLYNILHGIKYVTLRYANVYGPRQNPHGEAGVVAIFAAQMLTGVQPSIFGAGDKTRDYVHIADVVQANMLALERGDNSILNIGTGIETSDQEIFDTLADVLGYAGRPHYAPLRPGEVYRISLESGKAREDLGWSPRLSLKEGIARTADYYRELARRSPAT